VRINTYHDTADLELATGARKIELHIPFAAVHLDRRGALLVNAGLPD
jgi:hypothetical protein